jgi:hypothetical protein
MKITDKCTFFEGWLQNLKKPAVEGDTLISCTAQVPYILESNAHPSLIRTQFLATSQTEKKKLVRDSNPHLSFNHPLPTGRLIE